MNLPLLWKVKELPFSAALGTSVVMTVHILPATLFLRSVPYYLWVRAYKNILTPAFKFFALRGIYYFIIFPVISYKLKYPFLYKNMLQFGTAFVIK